MYKKLIGVIFMKLYVTDKWKIIKYTTAIFAICFVFTIANNLPLDVIQTIAGGKLLPIYNIETNEKSISLTFDCAWGAEDMDDILKIKNKLFFICYTQAQCDASARYRD